MNKLELRKIIRESIKEVMESKTKQMLNEIQGCHFHWQTGECGPNYCEIMQDGGGERCVCRSFVGNTNDCDETDTGSSTGINTDLSKGDLNFGFEDPNKPTGSFPNKQALNEKKVYWCTCRYYRCLRNGDGTPGGNSTLSWGGCTGSGACSCINSWKTGGKNPGLHIHKK